MKNEWDDLEIFKHVGVKIEFPYITITPQKLLILSTGFIHHSKKQIDKNEYVILSFSRSKNSIVFNFINDANVVGATKITKKRNASISAKSFLNYYSIDISKYNGKYIAKFENIPTKGNFWVLYLDEKI